MTKAVMILTEAQIVALRFAAEYDIEGPRLGWNADCQLSTPHGDIDGTEFVPLFAKGLMEAVPKPPPHSEESNEEGSLVRDHWWRITDAGRAVLRAKEGT